MIAKRLAYPLFGRRVLKQSRLDYAAAYVRQLGMGARAQMGSGKSVSYVIWNRVTRAPLDRNFLGRLAILATFAIAIQSCDSPPPPAQSASERYAGLIETLEKDAAALHAAPPGLYSRRIKLEDIQFAGLSRTNVEAANEYYRRRFRRPKKFCLAGSQPQAQAAEILYLMTRRDCRDKFAIDHQGESVISTVCHRPGGTIRLVATSRSDPGSITIHEIVTNGGSGYVVARWHVDLATREGSCP